MSARRHRTRSIVARLVVFLLLGAVVNVAVAWGFAIFDDFTQIEDPQIGLVVSESESWELVRIDTLGVTWIDTTRGRGSFSHPQTIEHHPSDLAPSWGSVTEIDPRFDAVHLTEQDGHALQHLGVLGAGWPLRSSWFEIYRAIGGKRSLARTGMRGAFDIGFEGWRGAPMWPRALPLRPIWPGFAINTFFYAAILWLLFVAPGRVRRWRRRKRGLCVKCAYPIGASDVCTECGAAISSGRRPARE